MSIFILTFAFFILVFIAMGIGYLVQQKTLAGSCGGLSSMGIEKACDCDNPCEKRLERERKAKLSEHSIDVKNI
ncbi:(Na+)-NQR maturation NqrM [Thalassotalea aquiviva]|uniref:(Na+)-NQR maturation NqrM n=1 Tax=Thalassotalea aquiviva TaxID=3242415 RepID=UPI00352A9641